MCRIILIILSAVVEHAHAERLVGISNAQESMQKLAGQPFNAEEDAAKLADTFLKRGLKASSENIRPVLPLRVLASLLTPRCAFMGMFGQPKPVTPQPKPAADRDEIDAVWDSSSGKPIDREKIDFKNKESLLAHAYWQEEALRLMPLPVEDNSARCVRLRGVARIPGALSKSTASALRDVVLAELNATNSLDDPDLLANLFSGGVFNTHANSTASQTRWELRLPMNEAVRAALLEMVTGKLGSVLEEIAGPNAELWELSAIISAPGSAPQVIHADTRYTNRVCLITTFVALQDVTSEMGPTSFVPGTHDDPRSHLQYMNNSLGFLSKSDGRMSVMDIGDATVYDSRVLHCGGANRSDRVRVLLCLTFRHEKTPERSNWSPKSIRAELDGRYTLQTLSRRAAAV